MPFIISLSFPTERYVAATMTRRDEVEWPPHPARLILGLLAAHHLGDVLPAERAALQWLCEQEPPVVLLPPMEHCVELNMKGVFVPQNPSEAKAVNHPRKERAFPSVVLPSDQPSICFHWPVALPDSTTRAALASLVGKLVRLGHSSSLVLGTLLDEPPTGVWQRLMPQTGDDPGTPDHRMRVPWHGLLESAENAYDANGREEDLVAAFKRRDHAKNSLTKFEASPRGRYDARHVSCGYSASSPIGSHSGPWDSGLCILTRIGGGQLGLDSTWKITSVLHRTILERWSRHSEFGPIPTWISGHQPREAGEATGPALHNHLAMFPLAHVDAPHASGHLLGLAFAIPYMETIGLDKQTLRLHWRHLLSCLLEDGKLSLTPQDHAWTFELGLSDGDSRAALQPSRWNAAATVWHSVTPIILDRHPKPTFAKDPAVWRESCAEIVSQACQRIGLPAPKSVTPVLHSSLVGVPSSPAFVAPSPRPGRPARFHIHATIEFAEPVTGPLLLGAGRFRGYGLMKPETTRPS